MWPTLGDIRAAGERIGPHVHRTPVMTCRAINRRVGASLFFKCENLQKAGAFKMRGATNAVMSLRDEEAAHGVATHSSGNHAGALALAASLRGVPAYVVMPRTAPTVKVDAVAGYGAEIRFCAPNLVARESTLAGVVAETGAVEVHPYDDDRVIAGQATATVELLADVPDLDLVMTPIGGGGLTSGAALAVRYLLPTCAVVAAEPAGADDAYRSVRTGRLVPSIEPRTIADGLLTSLSERTFAIVSRTVREIVTVDDADTVAAMRLIWERMKLVVEPSAAVPLGALLAGRVDAAGRRVGVVLSGGNVDLEQLPWASRDGADPGH